MENRFVYASIAVITAIIIAFVSYYIGIMHAIRDCHINMYETEIGTMISIQLGDMEFLHFEE